MRKLVLGVLGALLVSASITSHAAFETLDSRFGADSLVRDVETGLTFLRLDLTYGQSYNSVLSATESGGTYEGFRYIHASDLGNLFIDVPAYGTSRPPSTPETIADVEQFIDLMGGSSSLLGFTDSWGPWDPIEVTGTPWARVFSLRPTTRDDESGQYSKLSVGSNLGSFLVATPPVPEPETWVLLIGGLALVGNRVRARRPDASTQATLQEPAAA